MNSVLDLQKVTHEADEKSHVMGATITSVTTTTLTSLWSTFSQRC